MIPNLILLNCFMELIIAIPVPKQLHVQNYYAEFVVTIMCYKGHMHKHACLKGQSYIK